MEELALVPIEVVRFEGALDDVVVIEGGRKRGLIQDFALGICWEDRDQREQAVPDREMTEEDGASSEM